MKNKSSQTIYSAAKKYWRNQTSVKQRGAVAIFVALSMAVMIGFAGLALDLGRLYVNKSELQNAADACALAASRELKCDTSVTGTCPTSYLENAEISGRFVANKNNSGFQGNDINILAADVRFSIALAPNSGYLPRGSANTSSKYAMCIARANNIATWFMGILGIFESSIQASAVATLVPSQGFCNGPPIGVCNRPGGAAPDFGYTAGEWIASNFTSGGASNGNGNSTNVEDSLEGNFRWIDFTVSAGGNSEIRDQLIGNASVCNISVGNDVGQPGTQQGAKKAYNTRFGIYPNGANAYDLSDAPPDRTGYAYPNRAPGSPVIDQRTPPGTGPGAYADYRARQNSNTPFIDNQYGVSGPGGNIPGQPSTITEHNDFGAERRLVAVPVIECGTPGGTTPIIGMSCILMLNPMSSGATGTIYLEYRGNAAEMDSPCATSGLTSDGSGNGPLVPTLVQ